MKAALLFLLPVLGLALPSVEQVPERAAMAQRAQWYGRGEAFRAFRVAGTGSMRPYVWGGELVLVEKYAGQPIEPGMLVVAPRWDAPGGVLHEVREVSLWGYVQTQGRNCFRPDPWFKVERTKYIVRRVIKIAPEPSGLLASTP